MMLADLRFEDRDGVVLARLEGEVDMSNADEIRKALSGNVPKEATGLVVDLTGVRYLDSAGIQVVYELREQLKNRGQKLRLVVPQDSPIAEALRLAYVPSAVDVDGTVEAALEGIETPRSDAPGTGAN